MSLSFAIGTPTCLGFVTVWVIAIKQRVGIYRSIMYPIGAASVYLIAAMALSLEGAICVVFMTPIILACAVMGGVLAELYCRKRAAKGGKIFSFIGVSLLPLLSAIPEKLGGRAIEYREVKNSIPINASAEKIWQQIESVPRIDPRELPNSWIYRIGFPRPDHAMLVGSGIGAYREATFSGGLKFRETITEWQKSRILAFSIRANTGEIPAATFDEHVTLGGPYFDVLEGRYEIQEISAGRSILHLSSRQRLSTGFNFYTRFFTEGVMSEIQDNILHVVKSRAEK
ncbi:hypothetical protein [Nibricoccus sp. IMCC34717]|uniref:hypothetical protein n=1 Tax=Nibricoccus sp. IMCC34717 TaxID=3034021 RepID=UPI00384E8DBB